MAACIACSLLTACGPSQAELEQRRADSIANAERVRINDSIVNAKRMQDSIAEAKRMQDSINNANKEMCISFVKSIYNGNTSLDDSWVNRHCTSSCKSQLRKDYDYDGVGYAVWMIGGWDQDGNVGILNSVDVVDLEKGLYNAVFYPDAEMKSFGMSGKKIIQLQVLIENGSPKLNHYDWKSEFKY